MFPLLHVQNFVRIIKCTDFRFRGSTIYYVRTAMMPGIPRKLTMRFFS